MHYPAHANIFQTAVAAQAPTVRAKLEPFAWLFDDAGNYPDIFDNGTLPEADKDAIDPDWRRFCLYPPEFAGKNMHSWPFGVDSQVERIPLFRHLFTGAVDAWSAGDVASAIKLVGCLSHYLGDITQPAHLLDQQLMEQLLPAPPGKEAFHYHWTVEQVIGECSSLDEPRILGATIDEAVWRLMGFNRRAIVEGRSYIVPTVQALFRDDIDEAIRLAERPMTIAAEGTRDILATIIAIADGTVEFASTDAIDLRTWVPDESVHPVAYGRAFVDHNKTTGPLDGPLVAARLRHADGTVTNVRGLGVIGRSVLSWALMPGLYDRFEAQIGMHADMATEGSGVFEVLLDDQLVFESPRLTAGDATLPVSVQLGSAERLTLKVIDPSGGLSFYHNHAIWSEPRLVRERTP